MERESIKFKMAYLIIVHKDDEVFRTLLRMIDYPGNDVFIHMDSKLDNYDPLKIEGFMKYSKVFIRRAQVFHGVDIA